VISPFLPFSLRVKGRLMHVDRPLVMGILNVTPDSFYSGARSAGTEDSLLRAERMIAEGADILDIGGQSTRPGAQRITAEEELARVIPVIQSISAQYPDVILSVDTFYGNVAKQAVEAGAAMVNDVSAGQFDESLIPVIAEIQVPYVLMHMPGTPQTMQSLAHYTHVTAEVVYFLSAYLRRLERTGIHDILIDPGFGFGKNRDHNFTLLSALDQFAVLGRPVLAGISRKKMIQLTTDTSSEDSLSGTIAAETIALLKGASILRVHDVKAAVDAVAIVQETRKAALGRF